MTQSAGILLYKYHDYHDGLDPELQVLLVHPGGPYNMGVDERTWSIPKGTIEPGEDALIAAIREFEEETGGEIYDEPWELGTVQQSSSKHVSAWALEQDFDTKAFYSNTFEMEYPPNSGEIREYPENDEADWVSIKDARWMIIRGQEQLLDLLLAALGIED